jgi:predicted nucleotidyltransferase
MSRREILDQLCRDHGVLAVYLFGSRADDGLRLLRGEEVSREGSDLDVGIVFRRLTEPRGLSPLQADLENVFSPLRINLVLLQHVDALCQFSAIEGHRVAVTDADEADRYELVVMNLAEEMTWLQRQMEIERLGVSTTFIPDNERWLHRPEVREKLHQALTWAAENSPRETDLDELEERLARGDKGKRL